MKTKKLLTIDVGLVNMGIAFGSTLDDLIVQYHNTKEHKQKDDKHRKLHQVLDLLIPTADFVLFEDFATRSRNLSKVEYTPETIGHIIGICLCRNVPFARISPSVWKQRRDKHKKQLDQLKRKITKKTLLNSHTEDALYMWLLKKENLI